MVVEQLRSAIVGRKASHVMLRDFPKIDKDQTVSEALRLMKKHGVDRIIVTENSIPRGIMTKKDLVHKLLQERTRLASFSALHVSSFASPYLITVGEERELVEAARIMISKGISSLAVVDSSNSVTGLLRKHELVSPLVRTKNVKVGQLAGPIPYTARFGERILHVRQRLIENSVEIAPVLNVEGRVMGVISIDDIADAIIDFYERVPEKHRKEKKNYMFVEDYYVKKDTIVDVNDDFSRVLEKMLANGLRGTVVVKGNEPVGILTLDSITKTLAGLALENV